MIMYVIVGCAQGLVSHWSFFCDPLYNVILHGSVFGCDSLVTNH